MNIQTSHVDIRIRIILLIIIVGIGAFLRFYKLDQRWLWQDEAETAVLAQTVLEKGLPNAYLETKGIFLYTGRLISFKHLRNPSDMGKINPRMYAYAQADFDTRGNLRYHPFGDIYLTALSFRLFGKNTFTARLPFAILGILTIFIVYKFGTYLFNQRVGMTAAFLQAINVNLIFYDRMARHPALGNFCLLTALLFFLKAFRENKSGHWTIAVIFIVLVFFTNPLFALLAVGILLVQTVLVDKHFIKLIKNKKLYVSAIASFILALPYALILRPWTATNMFVSPEAGFFWYRIKYILLYIPELMSTVSLLLVFLGITVILYHRTISDKTLINFVFTFLILLLFVLPTTAGPFNTTLPLISIFIIISSRFLVTLFDFISSRFSKRRISLTVLVTPIICFSVFFPKITRLPIVLEKDFMEYKINNIRIVNLKEYLSFAKGSNFLSFIKSIKHSDTFKSSYNQWHPMWLPEIIEFLKQKKVDPHTWVFTTYQNPTFLFYSDFKVQSIWPIRKGFMENHKEQFWIIVGPKDHIRSPAKWYYGYVGWEDKDRNRNYLEVIRNAKKYTMKSGAIIYECNPI